MTDDHRPVPVRRGASVTCKVCGYAVVHYRATKLIRKPHWRHMTHQQGSIASRNPNRSI